MLDWTAPRPEEKSLRMEDYVLDFIPDCMRRVQEDSGEQDVSVIGYCFGGVLSLLYGSIFTGWADEEPDLLHHADRLPRDEAVLEFFRPPLFRCRPARRQRGQRAAGNDPVVVRDAAAGVACGRARCSSGKTSGTTSS